MAKKQASALPTKKRYAVEVTRTVQEEYRVEVLAADEEEAQVEAESMIDEEDVDPYAEEVTDTDFKVELAPDKVTDVMLRVSGHIKTPELGQLVASAIAVASKSTKLPADQRRQLREMALHLRDASAKCHESAQEAA